ncbi:MAG: hypothetical protein ACRDJT_04435 [Actinomycetota bacterium]
MDDNNEHVATAEAPEAAGLRDRTRQALEDATATGDAGRLELLENLYDELSHELERDVGETASSRR